MGEGGNRKKKDDLRGSTQKQGTAPLSSTAPASTAPACHFCLDGHHEPHHCPTVSCTEINCAYLAGTTQEPSDSEGERSERLKSVGPSQENFPTCSMLSST